MLEYQNIKIFVEMLCSNLVWRSFFRLKNLKILFRGHVISDLKDEDIVEMFYEKELQKANQKEFRVEKLIKSKCNKLYVKWKGYDSYFNSWIDKKDII